MSKDVFAEVGRSHWVCPKNQILRQKSIAVFQVLVDPDLAQVPEDDPEDVLEAVSVGGRVGLDMACREAQSADHVDWVIYHKVHQHQAGLGEDFAGCNEEVPRVASQLRHYDLAYHKKDVASTEDLELH